MMFKKKSTAKITLRTVFEHVQVQGSRLASLETEIKKEFKAVHAKMDTKFKAVHEKMDTGFTEMHQKIDAVGRRLSTQISNIDQRLDDVEIKELPKLKKAVGVR